MKNKKLGNLLVSMIGVIMLILSWIYYNKFSFIIMALGIALIGISIELYIKNKKDTTTETGKSRNLVQSKDERTMFINAKSGEAVNYIMGLCTIVALVVAKLLKVSTIGLLVILSLIFIRMIANLCVRNYYENRV